MPKRSSRGRPSKFTPETRKIILDAISEGQSKTTACKLADVDMEQLRRWMRRAKSRAKKDQEFRDFRGDFRVAQGKAVQEAIKHIRKHGRKTWQAMAWWAERQEREEWSDAKKDLAEIKKVMAEQGRQIDELLKQLAEKVPQTPTPVEQSEPAAPGDRRDGRT